MNFVHLKEILLKTLPYRKSLKNGTFRSIQLIFNQNVERLKPETTNGNSVRTFLYLKTIPDFRKKIRSSVLLWTAGFGLVGFVSRSISGIAVVVDNPDEHR